MSRLSAERSCKIYDDDHGYWVSIGPCADGLEAAEIVYSDGDKDAKRITIVLPWDHMVALGHAIIETAERNAPSGERKRA